MRAQNVRQVAWTATIPTSAFNVRMECTRRQMAHVHYAVTHVRTAKMFPHVMSVRKGITSQVQHAARASIIAPVATPQHIAFRVWLGIGGLQVVVRVV